VRRSRTRCHYRWWRERDSPRSTLCCFDSTMDDMRGTLGYRGMLNGALRHSLLINPFVPSFANYLALGSAANVSTNRSCLAKSNPFATAAG
jgi:hypothetical protein